MNKIIQVAKKSIRINDLNEAVKDYKAEVNLELKPLKEEVKTLLGDIKDMDERRQFLLDNADEVVEMDYSKAFDADELAKKKTELAEKSIRSVMRKR